MNQVMEVLTKRKSIRAYEERDIPAEVRAEILNATLRAPTAGNLMLYSILEITDQAMKDKLAVTCDHQSFIARAPLVSVRSVLLVMGFTRTTLHRVVTTLEY